MCGGTIDDAVGVAVFNGLSPRVRGNRGLAGEILAVPGSIPACAGEPFRACQFQRFHKVYPRVCGGTAMYPVLPRRSAGLSPRVRGNQLAHTARYGRQRSIPACAGEPQRCAGTAGRYGVYPRVCGGTHPCQLFYQPGQGLSPRVRGNHRGGYQCLQAGRSIPACAGEPAREGDTMTTEPVYPRVCGGTISTAFANRSG